ncbi:MAG: hypothetical protein GX970_00290 [Phyllobacteriaceae bacterium]|nr:hypothetical protein [Phyllobacteriaceae bacterium]
MDVLLPITSYPAVVSNVGLGRALSLSVRLGARVNALVQEMEIAPSSASGEALLGASDIALGVEALNRDRARNARKWVEERAASLELPLEVAALRPADVHRLSATDHPVS